MHSVRRLAAALGSLGAVGAMVLTMAGAVGAATGPPVGSAGQSGIQVDGGFATHVLVPHPRYLIDHGSLPASLAGAYMCSGLTAFAALFSDNYVNHQLSAAAPPPPPGKSPKQGQVAVITARLAGIPDLKETLPHA